MKKLILVCIFVFLSLFTISCKKEEIEINLNIYVDSEFYGRRIVKENSIIDFELEDSDYLFLGWYSDDTYTTSIDNNVVTNEMNIYAKTIKMGTKYSIIYHMHDEALFKGVKVPRSYEVGTVTQLVNPVRDYKFEFSGWYYNGNLITEIPDNFYGNIDLYDSWIDNNVYHTIEYVCDNVNTFSSELKDKVMEGIEYTLPYPIKEGYYFNGWYLDEDYTNRIYEVSKDNTSDLKVYAKFTLKTKANTYISFLGDSITTYYGYIPSDAPWYYPDFYNFNVSKSYWMQVVTNMEINLLKNNSYSGSRLTSDVSANGEIIPNACRDVRIDGLSDSVNDPDILICHIGTNDYSQGVDKYTYQKAIDTLVKKVRAKYDDVIIYFCLHPYNGYGANYVKVREEYNQVIIDQALISDYNVIDLTKCWDETNYKTYIYSTAHPNVSGFTAMANVITEELNKLFK